MAQSALRCSVADLSTVARGSLLGLGFFAEAAPLAAASLAAAAAAAIVVSAGDVFELVGGGFSDSGIGDGACSRRDTAEVRRGRWSWREEAIGLCGSHGGRLCAFATLHRGQASGTRGRIRGIIVVGSLQGKTSLKLRRSSQGESFADLLEGSWSFTRLRCKSPAIAAFWRGDCARVPVLEGLRDQIWAYRGLQSHKKCGFKELAQSGKLAQRYEISMLCPGVLKLGSGSRAGDAMVSSFTPEASRPIHWRRSWFQWNVRFANVGRKYMRRLVRLR